jgi:aryl-alcohol dehydrogenase-like predicted oxidoreductase/histidinol phosphatase-like enzyme
MRLSTAPDRDEERGVAVIHAALDAGATLLDTADAYCLDERDTGHNERLVSRALAAWSGDRSRITVATKGGIRRPKGAWVNDGRAKHLREACEASRRALDVDTIDLYQLHAVDPRVPLETSLGQLAVLQEEGKVRDVGLCNVTVSQIRSAQAILPIASVQVSFSPVDDENLRNGVAEYCRENGIRLIAYRPLGGERAKRVGRDAEVARVAAKHGVTAAEVALAWLMSFGDYVVPIPGATRLESAASLARVLRLELDDEHRRALDARFSGRLLRMPRGERRPRAGAGGDVVLVMGMPGAGKSTIARELEGRGYERLNRDLVGGSLSDLTPMLDDLLVTGRRQVVLDNTYPTRASRNDVIEAAWLRGVCVRCIWLTTNVADAQINSIERMIEVHGRLPSPEEIRERGKRDPRYLLPDAQFRYERTLEPPALDEGFESIERRAFVREQPIASDNSRSLILDLDELLGTGAPVLRESDVLLDPERRDALRRRSAEGWLLFVHAWRPQVARGETTLEEVARSFAALGEQLGVPIDTACCPHDAGPPVCWCRKPIPGSVIDFAIRRGVSLERSIVVGSSAADRTMAERIGARFSESYQGH